MQFYISPYVDAGLYRFPKCIVYLPGMSWTSIDLRNGYAVVALPEKVSCSRSVHLCDCARTPSLAVQRHFERKFSRTLKDGSSLGSIVYQLIKPNMQPSHAGRWPVNLHPLGKGQYEIWLGNELVHVVPTHIAEAEDPTFTDDFNRADEFPLSTGWSTMSDPSAVPPVTVPMPDLSDNKIVTGVGDLSHTMARYAAARIAADQSSTISTAAGSGVTGTGKTRGGGPCHIDTIFVGGLAAMVRTSIGRKGYACQLNNAPTQISIIQWNGSATVIATVFGGGPYTGVQTATCSATGSTIAGNDGTTSLSVTDTTHLRGQPGVDIFGAGECTSGGITYTGQQFADNFTTTGDLESTGGFTPGTC